MPIFSSLLTGKLAVSALALGTLAAGGTAATTAAFTGTLPAPVQQAAHELLGAPAAIQKTAETTAHDAATASGRAMGSATTAATTTGSAVARDGSSTVAAAATSAAAASESLNLNAKNLCSAFVAGALGSSTAGHHALSVAAGGDVKVAAYCDHALGLPVSASASAAADGAASGATSIPSAPAVPQAPSIPAAVPSLSPTVQVPATH